MNIYETYVDYMALRAHFSTKYDYHKYHGKIRASETAVSYRRDKHCFEKVSKLKDPHKYLLANILENHKAYIRDLVNDQRADDCYLNFVARNDSLSYFFKQDLKKLSDDYLLLIYPKNSHPEIVVLYLSKDILFETLCILAKEWDAIKIWSMHYVHDPIMEEIINKINKYTPFIQYDREKFQKFILDEFRDR